LAIVGGAPGVSGEVRLINLGPQSKLDGEAKVLATSDDVFFAAAFSPDGKQLAATASDGSVRIFDLPSGSERLIIKNHADWVSDICFSPDGKQVATASRDKTAKVFDAATGKLLTTYSEHKVPVTAVEFASDGKSVMSAGSHRIHFWNTDDAKLIAETTGFENDIQALVACDDGLLACSADRSVRQFKLPDRTQVRSLTQPASVLSLSFHDASHRLAAGCSDGTVTVWNLENGTMIGQFVAVPVGPSGNH
jgi:WD40 repeat protein